MKKFYFNQPHSKEVFIETCPLGEKEEIAFTFTLADDGDTVVNAPQFFDWAEGVSIKEVERFCLRKEEEILHEEEKRKRWRVRRKEQNEGRECFHDSRFNDLEHDYKNNY